MVPCCFCTGFAPRSRMEGGLLPEETHHESHEAKALFASEKKKRRGELKRKYKEELKRKCKHVRKRPATTTATGRGKGGSTKKASSRNKNGTTKKAATVLRNPGRASRVLKKPSAAGRRARACRRRLTPLGSWRVELVCVAGLRRPLVLSEQ